MKHLLSWVLVFTLLLSGCAIGGERLKEPVTFYYLRNQIQYGAQDSIIVAEEREASGHRNNLPYLLALYCMGPSSEDLHSPLPRSTRIDTALVEDGHVFLSLTDGSSTLTEAQFSLACACLTMTCLELTEAEDVTITSGSRSITMRRETLILFDSGAAAETETAQ